MEMITGTRYLPGNRLELTIIPCPSCHQPHTLVVDEFAFENWADGVLSLQKAFPEKTPGELELLLSGIDSECWHREVEIPRSHHENYSG
jgi:hypothetical protein